MACVEKTVFDGFEAVKITTECLQLVLVTEVGPRIAFLGQCGTTNNLLYWNKNGVTRGDWQLRGGHRVWISRPCADESEDTYAADNEPCQVCSGDNWVEAIAPAHSFTQLERGIRVQVVNETAFKVTSFVRNAGGLIYSAGVWCPTCINPQGKIIKIPLGEPDVTWDIVKVIIPRVFAGNTTMLEDSQVTFEGDDMVVKPSGQIMKRCVAAPQGIIAMQCPEQNLCFTKKVQYYQNAAYPLDGCNLAVFIGKDNWMGELESYSPEQAIRPGETVKHVELWSIETISRP